MINIICGSALMLLAGQAFTHDGTVYVTGVITDNTCTISSDSLDFTVNLGDVSSRIFVKAGDASPYKPFAIHLENCGGAASGVTVTFQGGLDSLNSDLLALNKGGGNATGLGVGIYNQDKTQIPMGKVSEQIELTPNQTEATLNFFACYIADGSTVASGTADASATFMLTYA